MITPPPPAPAIRAAQSDAVGSFVIALDRGPALDPLTLVMAVVIGAMALVVVLVLLLRLARTIRDLAAHVAELAAIVEQLAAGGEEPDDDEPEERPEPQAPARLNVVGRQ